MHVNVYNVNSNLFLRPRKELCDQAGQVNRAHVNSRSDAPPRTPVSKQNIVAD